MSLFDGYSLISFMWTWQMLFITDQSVLHIDQTKTHKMILFLLLVVRGQEVEECTDPNAKTACEVICLNDYSICDRTCTEHDYQCRQE